jgi:hypothetical protein
MSARIAPIVRDFHKKTWRILRGWRQCVLMTPDRLRTTNTLMALVILALLGQAAYQGMRISALKADGDQARRDLATRSEKVALEKLQERREDLVGAVAWVDEFYRSPDGLMRPDGLWNADAKKIDAEAIGTWVLDVYLKARIGGASDAEARQMIADNIKGSDEWRRKHPGK